MTQDKIRKLANRQLAPYRYGNGRVLWFDDCEHTAIHMQQNLGGAGTVAISTAMAWAGDKSYYLEATLDADSVMLRKRIPRPVNEGYIGLDFYFAITDDDYNNFSTINFGIMSYNKSLYYDSKIYMAASGLASGLALTYLDDTGAYPGLPFSFPLNADNDSMYYFHHCKLVIDTIINQYYYMMLDNKFFDLRGKRIYAQAATASDYIFVTIELVGKTAGAATGIYVDQITITDQEELSPYPEQYLKETEM